MIRFYYISQPYVGIISLFLVGFTQKNSWTISLFLVGFFTQKNHEKNI
jgi:hypothetical protein